MNIQPYQTILAIIGNVFNAHAALLFLPDATNKDTLRLVSAWCPTQIIPECTIIENGVGYIGYLLRNPENPLHIGFNDIQLSNINYYDENKRPDIKTFSAVSVSGGGVLVIDSLEEDAFEDEDQKLLKLFSHLLPQMQIMNATTSMSLQLSNYLYALDALRALKAKNTSWENYIKTVLQITAECTNFEYAVFASKSGNDNSYTIEAENVSLVLQPEQSVEIPFQSPQAGIIGWVLKNGENISNDGLNQASTPLFGNLQDVPQFQATICHKIDVENKTIGVLCLASRTGKPISQELQIFLKLVNAEITHLLERFTLRHKLSEAYKK